MLVKLKLRIFIYIKVFILKLKNKSIILHRRSPVSDENRDEDSFIFSDAEENKTKIEETAPFYK